MMAVALRSNLAREMQSILRVERKHVKNPFLCGSFSTTSTISTSKHASTRSNPLIHPSTSRYTIQKPGQPVTFHTSGYKAILPASPQVIEGTANDPAPVPHPSPTHGSYHWTFERLASAALIPLTVAPFAAGSLNPITDAVLCAIILIHSHIGFQSVIIDYIPSKRLPKTRALFWWGLRGASLLVAVGLYEFETNDVGLTEAIKRIWTA